MSEQVWWIVTLREEGDDEDSLYIVEGEDADAAIEAAEAAFADENNHEERDDPTMYVNHIVRCVGQQPTHVRSAPV